MKFQPLGTSGSELSDCKRYFVTRAWNSERWEVWLQVTDAPNERLAKNLDDRDAAHRFCENHQANVPRETPDTQHQAQ